MSCRRIYHTWMALAWDMNGWICLTILRSNMIPKPWCFFPNWPVADECICLSKHFPKTCFSFLWINIIFACPFLYALFFVLLNIKQQEVSCTPPVQHGTKTWFKQFRGDSNFQKWKQWSGSSWTGSAKSSICFGFSWFGWSNPFALCGSTRACRGTWSWQRVWKLSGKKHRVSYRYRYKWHPKLTN